MIQEIQHFLVFDLQDYPDVYNFRRKELNSATRRNDDQQIRYQQSSTDSSKRIYFPCP